MNFLAKRQEKLPPPHTSAEVGIVGIELESDPVLQAVEHRVNHVIHLDKEAAVHTDTAHHSPSEGLIDPPIGC